MKRVAAMASVAQNDAFTVWNFTHTFLAWKAALFLSVSAGGPTACDRDYMWERSNPNKASSLATASFSTWCAEDVPLTTFKRDTPCTGGQVCLCDLSAKHAFRFALTQACDSRMPGNAPTAKLKPVYLVSISIKSVHTPSTLPTKT